MQANYIDRPGVEPLWEIKDWDLPDFEWTPNQPHIHYDGTIPSQLRVEMLKPYDENWTNKWNEHIENLNTIITSTDQLLIDQMWKEPHWKNFNIPKSQALVINDKEGFKMGYHIDNRGILGVLLINIQDNEDSTLFMEDYIAPTRKGTGFFMLNNSQNHRINVTKNRFIVYQTLNTASMFTNM